MKFCMKCMTQYSGEFNICPACGFTEGTLPSNSRCMEPGLVLADRYIVGMPLDIDSWFVKYIGWDALTERKVVIYEYCPLRYSSRMIGDVNITVVKQKEYYKYMDVLLKKAQLLSEIHLPENISSIFETFEKNNTAYVISEYCEGQPLNEFIEEKGAMPPQAVEKMFLPILRSVDELHDNGFIIGGFSPYDLLVTGDSTLLLSSYLKNVFFNIIDDEGDLKNADSDNYYPYERLKYSGTSEILPANDVYSSALIMYRMMGARIPDVNQRIDSFQKKHKDTLKKPKSYKIKLDEKKENALMNALFFDISDRTPDVETFIKELVGDKQVVLRTKRNKKFPVWGKIAISAGSVAAVAAVVLLVRLSGRNTTTKLESGQTIVPSVINYSLSSAQEELQKSNLLLEIEGKKVSDDTEENQITSQSVEKGTIVEENSIIGVTVSAHSGEISMPNFLGLNVDKCTAALENIGINYSVTKEYDSTIAQNCVIAQSVTPYEKISTGSRVDLTVSAGPDPEAQGGDALMDPYNDQPTTVEDQVGRSYDDAVAYARDNGIPVEVEERRYDDSAPAGSVIEQYPPPGTEQEDEPLLIVVTPEKTEVLVPDVTLLDEERAKNVLDVYGLKAEIITEKNETVAAGLIFSQQPEAGATAVNGDTVKLTMSDGKDNVKMPDTVGKSRPDAVALLRTAGLCAKYTYQSDPNLGKDEVLAQSVAAGTEVARGSEVIITVNTKKQIALVPSVIGMTAAQASSELQRAGFSAKVYSDGENSVTNGVVFAQSPAPDLYAGEGSTVTLVLKQTDVDDTVSGIYVIEGQADINISPESITLSKGETFELEIQCSGIDDLYKVDYEITDESVVDAIYINKETLQMTFRGVGEGSTAIRISFGDVEKLCMVTVN